MRGAARWQQRVGLRVGEAEASDEHPRCDSSFKDVCRHIGEHQLRAPKHREAIAVEGAPAQVDEPAARPSLDVRTADVRAIGRTFQGPKGIGRVAGVRPNDSSWRFLCLDPT
jgi:hypothetical protein